VVLRPGQKVYFEVGMIRFVFRLKQHRTIRMIPRNYGPGGHGCATLLRADWLAGNKRGHSCVIAGGIVARR
jgi:hypothetical protein